MIRQKNGSENSRKKRKEGWEEVNERRGIKFLQSHKNMIISFLIIYVVLIPIL